MPRNASSDLFGRRHYEWNGHKYPSVTTVLRAVAKPALIPWAANVTADRAVDNLGIVQAMYEAEGREVARRWLTSAHTEKKNTAADIGTHVHKIAEMMANDQPLPPLPPGVTWADVEPYIEQWHRFVTTYWPEWIATECTVYSNEHDYAGTFDSIVKIEGVRYLLDLKTGSNVYQEVALQLAAYGNAEYMLSSVETLDPNVTVQHLREIPMFSKYAVLHLRPDGFRLIEIKPDFEAFLAARRLARFLDDKSWLGSEVLAPSQWEVAQ